MSEHKEEVEHGPDPHFEPIVSLPIVETKTLEEEEEEMLKLRAKLFRYDNTGGTPEWKERGTGDVKLLKHKKSGACRLLMRRDKTLKICANHHITPAMELKPNCLSDRAWVWSTPADFADEEAKPELLAIRFANADNAEKFRVKFEIAKDLMQVLLDEETKGLAEEVEKADKSEKEDEEEEEGAKKGEEDKDTDKIAEKLGEMSVKGTQEDKTKDINKDKTGDPDTTDEQAER